MIFSLRMIFFSEDNCFLVLIIVFLLLKIFFDDDILSDDVLFSDDSIFLIWWHFPRHCTLTNVTVNVSVARIKDDMWEQLECVSDYGLSADDSDVLTRRQSARYTNTPVTPNDHRGNNSGGSLIVQLIYIHMREIFARRSQFRIILAMNQPLIFSGILFYKMIIYILIRKMNQYISCKS